MQKILVTTDFSAHSKAGMRFAVQMATQMDAELIFFHCFQALIPTAVQRERIKNSLEQQTQENLKKLEKFVAGIHKSMKIAPGAYRCVVVEDLNPGNAILDFALRNGVSYICISTRGAGGLGKIIGTRTSGLLRKSPLPVVAVPHNYRVREIKKILYASDMENLEGETDAISALAAALDVKADLAHFYFPTEIKLDAATLKEMWRRKYDCLDRVYLEPLDVSFATQLDNLIKKTNPSIVALFTHTSKNWFDKLFSSSRSEAFSFVTKVPLLVYRKEEKK